MPSFTDTLRSWRRRFKAALPYVRRREFRVVQRNFAQLIEALDGAASPAAQAQVHIVLPLQQALNGDVCLFVSFAPEPELKPHVATHVRHLMDAGISVVLVVNTDLNPGSLVVDADLRCRLSGLLVRQNLGYDFGAWAHTLSLCTGTERWSRLFLVNDSVVGPLNAQDFMRLIARVRASTADLIGLTEALAPSRHLQSYFLVFTAAALNHPVVARLFKSVLNWPNKSQVIAVYESRLTGLLEAQGLHCEAMFPSLHGDPLSSDDTSLRWAELVRAGFPYLKTRVIAQCAHDERLKAMLAAAKSGAPPP